MKNLRLVATIALLAVALGSCGTVERYAQFTMTFFITSTGTGKGADFGGLEGADQHCQALASKVGAGLIYCFAAN